MKVFELRRLLVIAALVLLIFGSDRAMAQNGISGAEAIDATVKLLQARRFTPPSNSGLTYRDYIRVLPANEAFMTRIVLRVDAQGHFIPNRAWQNMHPEYCKMRSRRVRKAKTTLQFKMTRRREQAAGKVRDQTVVFAGFLRADTRAFMEQRQAEGSQLWETGENDSGFFIQSLSPDYVARVMDTAWDWLEFTGHGMVGLCGAELEKEEPDVAIQPRDGQWRIELTAQSTQGCPERVAASLGSMMGMGRVHTLDFVEPFHPEPLLGRDPRSIGSAPGSTPGTQS